MRTHATWVGMVLLSCLGPALPGRADDDLKLDQRLQRGVTISGARLYVAEAWAELSVM